MQETSCRCGATSYRCGAPVLYKVAQVFLSATARHSSVRYYFSSSQNASQIRLQHTLKFLSFEFLCCSFIWCTKKTKNELVQRRPFFRVFPWIVLSMVFPLLSKQPCPQGLFDGDLYWEMLENFLGPNFTNLCQRHLEFSLNLRSLVIYFKLHVCRISHILFRIFSTIKTPF